MTPEADLALHWQSFIECTRFAGDDDFAERMERAGLIEMASHPFGDDGFALTWDLTRKGRKALADRGVKA